MMVMMIIPMLIKGRANSFVNGDGKAPGHKAQSCMTTYMIREVLFALDQSAAFDPSAEIPQKAGLHVEYMIGLAQRGLVPKVFWWSTPEVVAILDGARRVAAAAGARAETAKAFAVRLTSSAASAGAPPDPDTQPWGADKWICPYCGSEVRRSNKSKHLKLCKKAPTAPQMNRRTRKRCLKKPNRAARCR